MTQFARPTLVAATDDGITLSTKFNGAMPALYTNHAGAAAPPSPEKGQAWIDTSGEGGSPSLHVSKIYDGTTWRTLGTLNLTAGTYTVAGNLPLAGGTLTGPILGAVGTAAAPGYSFAGDTNMGLYRISADRLGLSLNGILQVDYSTTQIEQIQQQYRISTGSPIITLNRLSGAAGASFLQFMAAGSVRWRWTMQGNESTGNVGSDMFLQSSDDAGALITNTLHFDRANRRLGINGTILGSATFSVRSNGAAVAEDALAIHNANVSSGAAVHMRFTTGAALTRGTITGNREAATTNGQLNFYSNLAGVDQLVLTLDSAKTATFNGAVVVGGVLTATQALMANGAITANGGINFGPSPWDFMYRFRYNSIGGIPATIINVNTADQGYIVGGTNIIQISLGSGVMNIADNVGGFWSVNLNPSDPRLKDNIADSTHDNDYWLSQINQIALKSFDWKPGTFAGTGHVPLGVTTDLLKAIDETLVVPPVAEGGYESVNVLGVIARLIAANQALTARVAALEGKA